MQISLITYDGLPDLDPDDCLFKDELVRRGHKVFASIWDDQSIDWSGFDVCIMRSAWDYHLKKDQFYTWIDKVARQSKLFNPPELMRWSSHKSYLKELGEAKLPVVETLWVDKGGRANGLFDKLHWPIAIVKPAVGLATFGVKKFMLSKNGAANQFAIREAEDHANELAKTEDVMIQPFLASVEDYGERALIFLNGEYTHTIRKSSFQHLAPGGHAGETSVATDGEEVAVAKQVIDYLSKRPLYARVDLVRDYSNKPLVLEVELVEPSLFFSFHPPAAVGLADALERILDLHKV
ncbi:MAG: hypothetical protein IT342_12220 [Candidatus Melainabacteria bacterium]|nr:hypothetical protein [Candidatus Melainabacteria bacterium]